jgi:cytoskeletal protein CcmA (bactofilin family)
MRGFNDMITRTLKLAKERLGRPEVKKSEEIHAFLGPQTAVEGNLKVDGTVRIDGHLKGSIASEGCTMIVGEKAFIEADISVHTITVSGEVKGNVNASHRIQLCPTARVFGDLHAPEVLVDAGAVLDGRCSIKRTDAASSATGKTELME